MGYCEVKNRLPNYLILQQQYPPLNYKGTSNQNNMQKLKQPATDVNNYKNNKYKLININDI